MLTVPNADCHIKAPYAECHYAECRGANQRTGEDVISNYGEIKLRNFRPNGTVRF
jgi:hypothetical protein